MTANNGRLTPKQERFVTEYLSLGHAGKAYRAAYDAENMSDGAVRVEACRLLQHPTIAQRIAEARKRVAMKTDITQQRIIEMLLQDREFAQSVKNASAATAASMGLAKVTGHLTEDRRNTRTPLQDWPTELLEELQRMLTEPSADATVADSFKPNGVVH